jgi:valyl-tRNA synthetase
MESHPQMSPDASTTPAAAPAAAASGGELPSRYVPAGHETHVWSRWERAKAFHADPRRVLQGDAGEKREPYSILIPPPNVTARLHLGHALNNTIQDILARVHRMRGFETLWMPGTDHAGIATQAVVEKRVWEEEKKRRSDFVGEEGRREFVGKIQAFKDEYEKIITDQLKLMGCSCDWDRQRFTMDPVCARAVREAFFILFRDGLIYRGKRLVNWDPALQTAVADDECFDEEVQTSFWYLRYPLVHNTPNGPGSDARPVTWDELASKGYLGAAEMPGDQPAWLTVATTRPETYLADTAVAVNPHDPRAKSLRGLFVELPLVGRILPIVEDAYVVLPESLARDDEEKNDPKAKFATGFLKVTPGHDENDYQLYQRHRAAIDDALGGESRGLINMMSPDGKVSDKHGWSDVGSAHLFVGLTIAEARKKVVAEFKSHGLLDAIKPYAQTQTFSDRSKAQIEPYLSDQWYVRVTDPRMAAFANEALSAEQRSGHERSERGPGTEASPAAAAAPQIKGGTGTKRPSDGEHANTLKFYPARYAKTYEHWHNNIRDWCISRQLWWGHRVPVWRRESYHMDDQIDVLVEDSIRSKAIRMWLDGVELSVQRRFDSGKEYDFVCVPPGHEQVERKLDELGFTQDTDVLDTWFSSGLWPLSTMGWPDAASAEAIMPGQQFQGLLEAFNPTSSLSTAREIITLWVSRMVMFNRYLKHRGADERHHTSGIGHQKNQDGGEDPPHSTNTGAGSADAGCPMPDASSAPVPFRDVFIHAVIQDGQGQKMSKSLGNGVDPLDIIATHGSDAMRFTLCHMTTQTQDVRLSVDLICPHSGETFTPKMITNRDGYVVPAPVQESPKDKSKRMVTNYGIASGEAKPTPDMPLARNTSSKFDFGRNYCNKLWNATRFALGMLSAGSTSQSGASTDSSVIDPATLPLESRWMLARLAAALETCDAALAEYQFSEYAQTLYSLLWDDFCDWYLEAIKPTVATSPGTRATLAAVLDAILRLLHPVAPFVTESLWTKLRHSTAAQPRIVGIQLGESRLDGLLCHAPWPRVTMPRDDAALAAFGRVQAMVSAVREVRSQHNVPPKRKVKLHAPIPPQVAATGALPPELAEAMSLMCTLAGLSGITNKSSAGPSVMFTFDGAEHGLSDIADAVDADAERARLTKLVADLEKQIGTMKGRLASPSYAQKAPPALVKQTQDQLAKAEAELAGAKATLEKLA